MTKKDFTTRDGSVIPITALASPSLEGKSKSVYLLPGDFHVSATPVRITTILGSCVSICLWDSENHIGGMNHYLLPEWNQGEMPSTRFGNLAALALLGELLELGCDPKNLKAKLFGGAALFTSADRYPKSLGAKNVEVAQRMLMHSGIPVIGQDTGGQHGRKILFDTSDCSAWSRKV